MVGYEHLIPDFDDMQEMIEEAARLQAKVAVLKDTIKAFSATCMKHALVEKDFWIGSKRPSMAYCEKIVAQIGNTKEDFDALESLRTELADDMERLETLEGLIQLSRDKLDLYRTFSANERKAHF